jgi:hypothetical protein
MVPLLHCSLVFGSLGFHECETTAVPFGPAVGNVSETSEFRS